MITVMSCITYLTMVMLVGLIEMAMIELDALGHRDVSGPWRVNNPRGLTTQGGH